HHPAMIRAPVAMRGPGNVNVAISQGESRALIVALRIKVDAHESAADDNRYQPIGTGSNVQRVKSLDECRAKFLSPCDQVHGSRGRVNNRRANDSHVAAEVPIIA